MQAQARGDLQGQLCVLQNLAVKGERAVTPAPAETQQFFMREFYE